MPFHPRDFRNVYLLASTEEVSETINRLGKDAAEDVVNFINSKNKKEE